jgi:hypothetical protein
VILFNFLWRKIDGDDALDISLQNTVMEKYVQDEVEKNWIRFVVSNTNTNATDIQFWQEFSYNVPLWTIVEYPEKSWNWDIINSNRTIDIELILKNINLPWNWQIMSYNATLPLELVLLFPDKPWNWNALTINNNIPFSQILQHPDLPWVFEYLRYRQDVPIDFIAKNNNINWDWLNLLKNPPFNHIQNSCETKTKNILIATIHEQIITNNDIYETDFERIMADCYVLSYVAKY